MADADRIRTPEVWFDREETDRRARLLGEILDGILPVQIDAQGLSSALEELAAGVGLEIATSPRVIAFDRVDRRFLDARVGRQTKIVVRPGHDDLAAFDLNDRSFVLFDRAEVRVVARLFDIIRQLGRLGGQGIGTGFIGFDGFAFAADIGVRAGLVTRFSQVFGDTGIHIFGVSQYPLGLLRFARD